MQRRLLVKAQRQVPVAAHFAAEHQHVARAVHRLDRHLFPFGLDEEHVLAIVLPVARRLPERLVEDERRLQLHVAGGEEHLAHVVREDVVERRPLVQPERRARRPPVEGEQPQLFPELAVIALLRFLDALQVRLQLALAEERRPVDALHRLVARVALPIGVRRAQQLEALQLARARHVRADAEVDERVAILDRVAGDLGLAFGLLFDQLDLQRLVLRREELARLVARHHLPLEGQVLRRQLLHLLLDALEVFGHERPLDHEVVEEALISRRADAALRAREQVGHRGREQVRRAVPVERERFRARRRDDADGGIRRRAGTTGRPSGRRRTPPAPHARARARSRPQCPPVSCRRARRRLEPSGSVTEMSLMEYCGKGLLCDRRCASAFARSASFGATTFAWLANRSSRSG